MRKKTLLYIGFVSLLLSIGCFVAAKNYLDELAHDKLYGPVVKVATGREILPYEPISTNDLLLVQEPTDNIQKGAATSIESLLGKRVIQTIYEGEQIIPIKLESGHLLPEAGEARYEFPLTSIMPVTELRKGDLVKVWVRYKGQSELENMQPPSFFKMDNPVATLLFQSQLATVKDSSGIEIYTLKPQLIPTNSQVDNPFFHGSSVSKTLESERRYRDYRAQPSAVPAYVGFNLTDQQYQIISEAMSYGMVQIGHVMDRGKEGTN
ncbi:SAF domain-containing protein [Brevibacillus sp. SYSU BS000544]|uniref:SAF domain-containing protein n=1 Tax=Brevibacillus sp. SYSU BS000544 TaxID=3416443 RepID=UPI003CE533AC